MHKSRSRLISFTFWTIIFFLHLGYRVFMLRSKNTLQTYRRIPEPAHVSALVLVHKAISRVHFQAMKSITMLLPINNDVFFLIDKTILINSLLFYWQTESKCGSLSIFVILGPYASTMGFYNAFANVQPQPCASSPFLECEF